MTSGNEISPAPTRRLARTVNNPRPHAAGVPRRTDPVRPSARWSRRRGVVSVFAALAALGFVAANVAPTGAALAEAEQAAQIPSLYADAADEAQSYTPATEIESEPVVLDRDGYSVYVTPKPTPTPTAAPQPAAPQVFAGPPPYTGGGSPAEWMSAAGIAEADWGYVDYIVGRESGWNPNATNSSSGACGLVQVYPCSKLPNAYDPVVNLGWANGYAIGRYGGWAGAYNFWITNHWW